MEARVHDLADGAPDGPACRGVDASTMTKGYVSLIDKAATIAAIVHRRQHRKATSVPYFVHPAQVALILARHGYPDILQAAGMLHDVLEDADPDDAETRRVLADLFGGLDDDASDAHAYRRALAACLRREVGPAVVTLVEAVSEVKTDALGRKLPWPERKRQALAHYGDAATPDDVLVLKSADVLHNAQSIRQGLEAEGLSVMNRFNATADQTLKNYVALSEVIQRRLSSPRHASLVGELRAAVDQLRLVLQQQLDDMRGRVAAVAGDATP